MSNATKFRDMTPELLEKYASVEEFLRDSADETTIETLGIESRQLAMRLFCNIFQELTNELLDVSRWRALSSSPLKFDEEVDSILTKLRALLKRFYGIPHHRPPQHSERDLNIVRIKTSNPSLTFGQVAVKVGLSASKTNLVEMAFNRARERERNDLKQFLETLVALVEDRDKYRVPNEFGHRD